MLRRFLLFMLVVLGLGSAARATSRKTADLSLVEPSGANAQWDSETHVFTWTFSYDGRISFPDLTGDLSGYALVVLETEDLTDGNSEDDSKPGFRLDLLLENNETLIGYNYKAAWETDGRLVVDLSAYDKEKLAQVKEFRLNTNSNSGSVVVKSVSLVPPLSLDFDEDGKAYIRPQDLADFANGLTVDVETGKITKRGTDAANIKLLLDDVDLSDVASFKVECIETTSGLWTATTFQSDGWGQSWYTSRAGATVEDKYRKELCHASAIELGFDESKEGEVTISSICLQKGMLTVSGNDVVLKDVPFYDAATGSVVTPLWNVGKETAEVYGNCNNVQACGFYADLDGYKEIRVYPGNGCSNLRFWFMSAKHFNEGVTGTDDAMLTIYPIPVEGKDYAVIDIAGIKAQCAGKAYLMGAKANAGTNVTISDITALSNADYTIGGFGLWPTGMKEEMAASGASIVDATGLNNFTPIALETANPNCLFLVSDASKLSNEKNVLVKGEDGTYACANLDLESGYSFRTPYAFTAGKAEVKKTVGPNFGTFVSPFEVAVPESCKAYNLTGVDENNVVTGEETVTVTANKPVLLAGDGECTFEAEDVTVEVTPASLVNGILNGVYESGITAPQGSYVLQTQDDVTAFYNVAEADKQKVTPFTAYLTLPTAAGVNAQSLSIGFDNEGTTYVDAAASEGTVAVETVYDLQGRKLGTPIKGVNLLRLSDGSVKKVVIK